MKHFTLIILICFVAYSKMAFGQAVTASNCNQAINICSNAGFQIDPNGVGTVNELPGTNSTSNPSINPASANSGCLLIGESNSTWMVVNIQTAGVLQFSFGGGGAQAGYYDWAMWPYSATACAGIQGNTLAPVRCNWNGVSNGGTGLASPIPAGGTASNYEPPLNVTCGQKFVICFSNYSGAATTVPLNFFGSAIVSCAPIPNPITATAATICSGQVATLTASGATGNTYTWTPGGATGASINVSPGATTTYTVSGSGGCGSLVGTQTTVVNVTGGPNSSISSVVNNTPGGGSDPTPAVQCLTPNSFNFNAPAATGTHFWDFGGGGASPATSAVTNPTGVTYSTPGTYTVTHSVSNGGCVSTSSTVVTITSPPTAIVSSVPVCATTNSASVVASGGIPGYTYNWLPSGGSGTTATGLALGTYSVTVTDANGCTVTSTVIVSTNPKPSGTLTFTNPTCGANNGVIIISNTSPATPPQTVVSFASTMGSVSGQTVTGLGAGTPVITLTNNFGCTFTVSATLTNIPGPTALPLTPNNIICGIGTGSITIGTPTGGTAPYTYNVNGGAFSASPPVTGLASGTYTIGVRDANGCIFTNTVTISVTTGPTAISGTTSPSGCGLTNGTYNITGVTGGTGPYTFTVNSVASGSLTSNLAAGTYPVIVKDFNGCLFNTTFVVAGTTGPSTATIPTTNASCGSANGSATVTAVTGGLLPYQYSFDGSTFATTTSTTGLSAGTHTVIIKDANTCTVSVTYNVLNSGSPTASVTSSINVSCFGGSNGSFTVTPSGGTGPAFTYTLVSPSQTNGTGQFSGLPQGTYNIIVKDQLGCATTTTVTLTQPTVLTLTPTSIAAKCFGTATGTINITGAGGTPTYSYNLNSGTYQSSSTFSNQFSGLYSMGIKDANGCTATQTVQITQPIALAITVSTQNANCTATNGVASATVTGGTGVITYTWTGGGGASAVSNSVIAGNYSVTATDANGCVISSAAVIGLTSGGTASVVATSSITCNGLCNGNITVGMTGGAAPFTYSWSPSGGTGPNASNLCPGTYTCVVKDFYGCISTASGTIIQPPALAAIMNSNNVKCFATATGTVSAAGTGGTAPYTYMWTSPITNTASTVSNVAIGNYVCTITDANNCSITQSISVTQPTSLTITSTITAANCNLANGCASITVSGGAPPYTQIWSNGNTTTSICNVTAGTYTVNITDANLCPQTLAVTIPNLSGPTLAISSSTNVSCFGGSNGGATATAAGGTGTYVYSWSNSVGVPVATNLVAGVYTASVTDQAGCIASASVSIIQPTALTVNIVPTQPKCFGALNGGGAAAAVGGTPSYTYAWTSTGGNASVSNSLGAGNYVVTVTDGNLCTATASMALVNPPAMMASISSTSVTCFGLSNGMAVASSTNGIGVVSYYWTGTPSPVTSQTLSNVPSGSYTVLCTDQNSCTASAQVTIIQPTQVTANITATGSVTCNGGNNGFAAVTAAGGTGAHTYNWSPSNITAATANTLTAGIYVVTVSDANLCTATATATILEPTPLATTLTTTNVKCNGGSDGTGNISYLGGAGATTFLWSQGLQSGNPVNNLMAGPQSVTVTSNGSCPAVLTFTLTQPAPLTVVVTATNSNCGQNNGKACAVVSGGTGALTSLWSNNISTLCNNNILAGAYTYSVTDANGCVAQASGLVNDIAGPVVSITSQTNISCFGGTNGAATTNITGGVMPYTTQWSGSPTFTTQNVSTGFNVGIKNITVTDDAGCVGTASVQITEPIQLASAVVSSTNVSCFAGNNGGATVLANGGTGVYSYSWSPSAQINPVLTNVPASIATVVVTDANGCISTSSVVISQPPALVMAASSFSNISCFGGSNGQISTTVQGGFGGFTYTWLPSGSAPSLSGLVAGGYSVTVTDGNGCSINANFNIIEPSALTSTYTSIPATCGLVNGSGTVILGGGTPTYNLVWSTPGTPTGSVVSGLAPGNWSVLGTDSKGCSITQIVNVANPPTSTITGFVTTQPKCFGYSDGSIVINYTAGSGPYTISWASPISQTITTAALTQSVAGISSGAYTATLTDVNGCITSAPVIVSPTPKIILTPTPLNATICYGQTTQISASTSGGTGAYTYTWTPTFAGQGPHSVNPTTTTVYNVAVSDVNGCLDGPKNITINVTPQLVVTPTVITVCHGVESVFTPSLSSFGNGGPYTYTWSPSGVNTTTLGVVGNAISGVATTYTYGVMVDDGCTFPYGTATYTLNVNPLPIISFTALPTSGCAPLTVALTGTSNGASDIFTWGDVAFGNQGSNAVVVINDSGLYTASLIVENPTTHCFNDIRKTNYIEVYPKPRASFYANPQTTSILDPNINFVNTSQGAVSYYWNFGDPAAQSGTNTSILVNPSHGYTFVGPYAVNLVATSIKGCTDTARIMVEITPDFALYIPNTFTPDGNGLNDIFQPLGVGIDEENYRMDVYDRWGENIFTSNSFRKGWDGTVKGGSKIAEQGVYTYKMIVKDTQGGSHPYVGHVTLLKKDN